ncbi:DMT family transporter [Clostridium malenominatum]|uniref:DMT family transporter n=1 Tax=Clostridium malenominatum TaxID=1539 RepID=A0ABN1J1Y0_9CLOT
MLTKIKNKSLLADFSLLIIAVIWGSGFVATKNALDSYSPYFIMASRFFIACVSIGLVFFKNIKKITKKDFMAGSIIGFLLFIAFAAQTIGLQYTTAAKQAFITGTNVVMVPFIYWLVNSKKPDIYNLIAAFMCFIGIGFLTLEGSLHINLGDGLTLACALFFACHIVAIGYYAEKHDPIVLTFVQFLVAFILSLISIFSFNEIPSTISKEGLFPIIYLGVFSTFIAFLIQNVAQKYTTPTRAAIILCLEAVFGSLLSCFLLGEDFTYKMFIGCIVIFLAIVTAETKWEFIKFKGAEKNYEY